MQMDTGVDLQIIHRSNHGQVRNKNQEIRRQIGSVDEQPFEAH